MQHFLKISLVVLSLAWSATADTPRRHIRKTAPIPKEPEKQTAPLPGTPDGSATRPTLRNKKAGESSTVSSGTANRGSLQELGFAGIPKACEQKPPIDTYVQISYATKPQASRKGGVYFLSDLRDSPQVFHLSEPKQWPKQISFFPDGVVYFQLSPDGEKLLLATHQGGDEQYNIYLFEPGKGDRLTPLLVDRATRVESVAWDPSSRWFAYTSNARNKTDFDLYKFELAGLKSELLAELKGHNSVTDVSPDGSLIALTNFRSVSDADVVVWDFRTKSAETLPKVQPPTRDGSGIFAADSKGIYFLSDQKAGYAQLYLATLKGQRTTRLLTSEKWEIEDFSLDNSRSSLAYAVNENGYGRLVGLDMDESGRKRRNLAVPTLPRTVLSGPSFRFGFSRKSFFFARTSPRESSDIWEWKAGTLNQWTKSTHGLINPDCFSQEELVQYPSFDGKQIPAFLFRPPGTQGPVPFILYVHGGPESQYRPTFSRIFQYYLHRGYGVFAPNVRGSTGYGKEYTELDNYKRRMDSVKDAIEGAKWLIANRHSSAGALAIYGGSYGGFMVLRTIQTDPSLFAAACESVGITDFVTFLKNTKPYRRALREAEYGPLADEEFLKSISPMTYLDQIKTPLLVFHGANDPRVPVTEAEQIIKELKDRKVPVESKIFADEGHGNAKLRNIMEQARTMVYFFETHVRKPGSPPAGG